MFKMILISLFFSHAIFAAPVSNPGNVLIIIVDDLGTNELQCYGSRLDGDYPFTPYIDALRTNGILFRNVYAAPSCSPTRAGVQTGRYGFRTGMGTATLNYNLPMEETIIPEVLDRNSSLGYRHAAIGKWHISSLNQDPFIAPNVYGYNYFSGTQGNLGDYCNWTKIQNGVHSQCTNYATTENIDDALTWISQQNQEKWFMWLALNAPHSPYHVPPSISSNCSVLFEGELIDRYQLMIERIDMEIGRLITIMDPMVLADTTIIFMGDNGTPQEVTVAPFVPTKGKGTIYEGGIKVPMIISGNKVVNAGREVTHLVNSVDIFATALELMGVNLFMSLPCVPMDSISLTPIVTNSGIGNARSYMFSEKFINRDPEHADYCIRDYFYKYLKFNTGVEELYNVLNDPYESINLFDIMTFEEQLELNKLRDIAVNLRSSDIWCNQHCCGENCWSCCNDSHCQAGWKCSSERHTCMNVECLTDGDCVGGKAGRYFTYIQIGTCMGNNTCCYGICAEGN